jgi:hypothetical protein
MYIHNNWFENIFNLNIFIIMFAIKLNVLILVTMITLCVKLLSFIVVFLIYKLITDLLYY